jgi:hypothetical protein
MQLATGKVVAGKVLVEGLDLHESQLVTVLDASKPTTWGK